MTGINISDHQIQQFRDEGYLILEDVIPAHHLKLLRENCDDLVSTIDRQMDLQQTDTIGINHRGKRYFVTNCFREREALRDFLFSELMEKICRATLGQDAYLFWEQYVLKGASKGMKFSWHQDAGYVGFPDHSPYVTAWCALDDMTETNGPIRLLPYSSIGIRSWVQHIPEPGSNDLVGYFGNEQGILVEVPAGSIALFSSVSFHCSGPNGTNKMRRAYLAQYSTAPILTRDGAKLWGNAEPFLRAGKNVVGTPGPSLPSQIDDGFPFS